MKRIFKVTSGVVLSIFSFVLLTTSTMAQGFLPDPIQNILDLLGPGGGGTSEFVQSRVSTLLLMFLGVIILAAVVYTAFAALKYIRSQGEEGEIETATKGIQAIFQGIAMMLIAIVGIVITFVFFGAELFGTAIYQTCISAPNSPGCNACNAQDGGLLDTWDDAKFAIATAVATNVTTLADGSTDNQVICGQCEWLYFASSREDTDPRTYMEDPAGAVGVDININLIPPRLTGDAWAYCTE